MESLLDRIADALPWILFLALFILMHAGHGHMGHGRHASPGRHEGHDEGDQPGSKSEATGPDGEETPEETDSPSARRGHGCH